MSLISVVCNLRWEHDAGIHGIYWRDCHDVEMHVQRSKIVKKQVVRDMVPFANDTNQAAIDQ